MKKSFFTSVLFITVISATKENLIAIANSLPSAASPYFPSTNNQ